MRQETREKIEAALANIEEMTNPLLKADVWAIRKEARLVLALLREDGDGWQDISTAPKDGTQILACALLSESLTAQGHVPDISVVKWDRDDWVAMADGYHAIKSQGDLWTSYHEPYVTHWQPLPPTRAQGESS